MSKANTLTKVLVVVGLLVLVGIGIPSVNAATNVGKPCTKIGSQIGDGPGKTLVCQSKSGKKVWQILKKPTPSTRPTLIPGSSATPSPTSTTNNSNQNSNSACTTPPIFTHDFIDPKYVRVVTPIGEQTGGGGVLAVRSYVHPLSTYTGQELPIYAPTDMYFVGASYYKPFNAPANYQPEYSLYFDLGCSFNLQYFHIKGVIGNVAKEVPTTPTSSSASQSVPRIAIKAGEQIGWYKLSEGSVAFDFWVDNMNHTNTFIVQSHFLNSNALHSVCPYDFYVPEKKAIWLSKLGAPGSDPIPGTQCGVVNQGKLGSADGMWFFSTDTKTDALSYDGPYQSQIVLSTDASGMVRIGGLANNRVFNQMMVGSNSTTYFKPSDVLVGQEHCWSDSNQSIKVSVVSNLAMKVVVGAGGCSDLPDFSQGKTYVR